MNRRERLLAELQGLFERSGLDWTVVQEQIDFLSSFTGDVTFEYDAEVRKRFDLPAAEEA